VSGRQVRRLVGRAYKTEPGPAEASPSQ
jgi:hypothetical protein